MPKHVVSIDDLSRQELLDLIETGLLTKKAPEKYHAALTGKTLLLLFQKTSTRTSLSFQAAIGQLGGHGVFFGWDQTNFSLSPLEYEAHYVARNCHAIVARMRKHKDLLRITANSRVPVINGCDERHHPSQALTDIMTIYETCGTFDDIVVTFVGVHNNITNSLVAACLTVGLKLILVTPLRNEDAWDEALMQRAIDSGLVSHVDTLHEAAQRSDFVYTDTWVDMEFFNDPAYAAEKERRIQALLPYQVDQANLGGVDPYLMHDMPIHPGFEISDDAVWSPKSIIFRQAENRLHAAKALLLWLMA